MENNKPYLTAQEAKEYLKSNFQTFSQHISASEDVNPEAEKILINITGLILAIGGIASLIMIISGLVLISEGGYDELLGGFMLIFGTLLLIIALIQWAFARVFTNISRNLFNLNDKVEELKKHS